MIEGWLVIVHSKESPAALEHKDQHARPKVAPSIHDFAAEDSPRLPPRRFEVTPSTTVFSPTRETCLPRKAHIN